MSGTQMSKEHASQIPTPATVDQKLEVIVLPVSDVDRAKRFYEGLGWRLDGDFTNGADWRVVQLTPPGSPCSVFLGKGLTTAAPGSVQGMFLVVHDVDAARAELVARGVDVSDVFHFDANLLRVSGTKGRVPGPDPEASFLFLVRLIQRSGWQQLAAPGDQDAACPDEGESSFDVATLTELLKETEDAPWRVRTNRSKAPLVGVVRRVHRCAPAGEDARGRRQGGCAPHGRCPPLTRRAS